MKVYFVTKNSHKFSEVKSILNEFNIQIEQLSMEKDEDKEKLIEDVALYNAELFASKHNVPIVVEDTGFYYNAYPNFPGPNPKLMFNALGYKGLLKLLENEKDRGAEFKAAVAFAYKGEKKLFTGKLKGVITEKTDGNEEDVMPYERIFIPEGQDKLLAFIPREEKNKISHRYHAFRQFAEWFVKKYNNQKDNNSDNTIENEGDGN